MSDCKLCNKCNKDDDMMKWKYGPDDYCSDYTLNLNTNNGYLDVQSWKDIFKTDICIINELNNHDFTNPLLYAFEEFKSPNTIYANLARRICIDNKFKTDIEWYSIFDSDILYQGELTGLIILIMNGCLKSKRYGLEIYKSLAKTINFHNIPTEFKDNYIIKELDDYYFALWSNELLHALWTPDWWSIKDSLNGKFNEHNKKSNWIHDLD